MPRLPQVSGKQIVQMLHGLGYQTVRQKGSHIRLRRTTALGEHNVTVPNHKVVAKGTLSDILTRVSLWNNLSKDDLIERLR